MIELKGIAWNHTRGFTSVVATAQRFEEQNPEVTIHWEKRSLQAFADASMEELSSKFDLIVMDHPHTALAATGGLLLPFEEWLSEEFIDDQASNSVGRSHASYRFGDRQWTLASDAATPIATWRLDLIAKYGIQLPQSWDDVLSLAKEGFVTVSAFPVDVLMHSYMFCQALQHVPFSRPGSLAPVDVLADALEELRKLVSLCEPLCLDRNPIRTAEWMSSADDDRRAVYCPFAYGYSNYSRPGFSKYVLEAGGLVRFGNERLRSTLGGAGMAVSSKTKHPEEATRYAAFTASPEIQRGLYFEAGGQPGHRAAWNDERVNAASHNFFRNTLQTLDEATLRPQFPGYMDFQDVASPIAHGAAAGRIPVRKAAEEMSAFYEKAFAGKPF